MIEKRAGADPPSGVRLSWDLSPIAVFWDQSLVWGLILVETLQDLEIPFQLLTGADIRGGALDRFGVLVVPGGWASHKLHALGERGTSAVKQFVQRGGCYLGFCGGAGLALSSPPSLGLAPVERMGLADRLPNASGTFFVQGIAGHPAWKDLPESLPVSIWWPSQFAWQPLPGMLCLAVYQAPGEDFCVADLPFQDLALETVPWEEWESIYGINLNPKRLVGHPAILELKVGRGRVVLSYPHLETPGDEWGNRLLWGLLAYLGRISRGARLQRGATLPSGPGSPGVVDRETREDLRRAREVFEDLVAFGERQLLWRWRSPWLLQWRRGIRGLEYGSLTVLARAAENLASSLDAIPHQCCVEPRRAERLLGKARLFCREARRLLLQEKLATQNGGLTKLGTVNDRVDTMRVRLFGKQMNHAGLCGELFNELDEMLCLLLRAARHLGEQRNG